MISLLEGCPYAVFSDHKPLIGAIAKKATLVSSRQQRQLSFYSLFIQLLIRASTQVSVSMEVNGMASSHLLDRSIMVNRYRKPSLETVSGPTKST